MPRKQRNQPTGSRYGSLVATAASSRVQFAQSGVDLVDGQHVVLHHDPVGRVRPRQLVDPPAVPLRPRSTRIVQSPAQQQLAEAVPASLPVRARIIPSSTQVANRFRGRRRGLNRRQHPRPMQLRELARIASVGLDALAGLPRYQRRRDHLALHPTPFELPLQRIPAGTCLVAARNHAWGSPFQLPTQPLHRPLLVPNLPRDRFCRLRGQQSHHQLPLVRIDPHVGDRLAHDRLPFVCGSDAAPGVNPRIAGGFDHRVACSRTTTVR